MRRIVRNLVVFLVVFSMVFWFVRETYGITIFLAETGNVPWLYSTIGLIFGILAAFVIQREWEAWANLDEAVRIETDRVRELWRWSAYAPARLRERAREHLVAYLRAIGSEWGDVEVARRSPRIDAELEGLRDLLPEMSTALGASGDLFVRAFGHLTGARNQRLNASSKHIPALVKRTLFFADGLVIILSIFVGVQDPYLDYLFTASIGVLAFSLYIVIEDLDHPFRPGGWHLTTASYEQLLAELAPAD